MSFEGKVALITGAGAGIGREVAVQLARRGARVALTARTESTLTALAQQLGGDDRARAFPLDVTDRAALLALPAQVHAVWGRLDFVVNNAGVHHRGPLLEQSAEQLAQMVETNLTAPIVLSRAALEVLQRDGVIVNVASLAGKVPVPGAATYSSTKFGLRAFGRALDLELKLSGRAQRVLSVSPGPVDTGFFGEDLDRVANLTFSQPMRSAAEVAAAVLEALARPAVVEIDVPGASGALATLGYVSPKLYAALRPLMEQLGARNKRRYQAELAARGKR